MTPLEDGTGYVITFLKSGNITIKHGEKGEQGNKGDTPVVSVKQDADGKYYWTINGEWLLDNGNKIPVTGEKGDKGDTGSAAVSYTHLDVYKRQGHTTIVALVLSIDKMALIRFSLAIKHISR